MKNKEKEISLDKATIMLKMLDCLSKVEVLKEKAIILAEEKKYPELLKCLTKINNLKEEVKKLDKEFRGGENEDKRTNKRVIN